MVLVDTPIWSLMLRRATATSPEAQRLRRLVDSSQAAIIGPIRQELLSGIRDRQQYEAVRERLRPQIDLPLRTDHFERAAAFCNACRARGIQGSAVDFLICAVADLEHMTVYTTDKDFSLFARHLPIRLT
jgi:predicted nucleic acid-binding protein